MTARLWVAIAIGCSDDPPVTTDEPEAPTPFANDADADGYEPPFDCDDGDASVFPGHGEFCNGVDDDCDGAIDDDPVDGDEGFVDADGDGVGDSGQSVVSCSLAGLSTVGGDCDDSDPTRSPAIAESCNGVDDDCSGAIDEGGFVGDLHHPTLQGAVFAAGAGDTIVICAGSTQYEGGIVVDRAVTLTAHVAGDAAAVVIDGSSADSAVFVVDGGDLTLEGLTVRGGRGAQTPGSYAGDDLRLGGAVNAVFGAGGPVTVRNCVFEGNSAQVGGAIAVTSLEVSDTTFVGNVAGASAVSAGGALWIGPDGWFEIERTVFDGNVAESGEGGALQTWSSGFATEVEAAANDADFGGFADVRSPAGEATVVELVGVFAHDNTAIRGGAFEVTGAVVVADATTLLSGNGASLCGAVSVASTPGLVPTSWTGGTLEGHEALGGGGMCLDGAAGGAIEVSDVVIRGNQATDGGGISMYVPTAEGASVVVRDSVISANVAFDNGGGVDADGDMLPPLSPNVSFERVEIVSNEAGNAGGGLWTARSWVAIEASAVLDNVAPEGGGAFVYVIATLEADATDFAGNIPEDVFVDGGLSYDAADVGASFSCTGADAICQ